MIYHPTNEADERELGIRKVAKSAQYVPSESNIFKFLKNAQQLENISLLSVNKLDI